MKLLINFLCSKQNFMNIFNLLSFLAFSSLILASRCSSIASIKALLFSLETYAEGGSLSLRMSSTFCMTISTGSLCICYLYC